MNMRLQLPESTIAIAVIVVAVTLTFAPGRVLADLKDTIAFDIAAQQLPSALNRYSEQAGVQVTSRGELIEGKTSAGVTGKLAASAALETLLKDTQLRYDVIDEKTVVIVPVGETAGVVPPNGQDGEGNSYVRVAQNDTEARDSNQAETAPSEGAVQLDEIVVTGTSIRGIAPVGSQVIEIDRAAIERNGFATAQDIVRSLPQNYNGGFSEDTGGAAGEGNASFGASLNLRGLGASSTLILINGRRLAGSGVSGDITDISGIPVSAIERVEVLPDGASAIYGSDAVGGVVNYVLRRDYQGAETSLRIGSTTQGGAEEVQFGQTFGRNFSAFNALLGYEYYSRSQIEAADRDYTASSNLTSLGGDNFDRRGGNPGNIVIGDDIWGIPQNQDGTALQAGDLLAGTPNFFNANEARYVIPDLERHSALGRLQYQPNDSLSLFGETLFTHRDSQGQTRITPFLLTVTDQNPFYVNPTGGTEDITVEYSFFDDLGPQVTDVIVDSLAATVGMDLDLTPTWSLRFSASHSSEDLDQDSHGDGVIDEAALRTALDDTDSTTAFNPFGAGSNTNPATLESIRGRQRFEAESTISEYSLVADGPLMSVPAGRIRAALGLDYRNPKFSASANGTPFADTSRNVRALFAEVNVPLLDALELSAAARFEDYSDFGSVLVPKVGARWRLTDSFSMRGTWGESYRAPSPADLNPANAFIFLFALPDSSAPGGSSNALVLAGTNAGLEEESARTLSLGLDFQTPDNRWQSGITYFRTAYTDRIFEPLFVFDALDDPNTTAAIDRAPTLDDIAAACAGGQDFTGGVCTAADAAVIVDFRKRNAAEVDVEGLDLSGALHMATALGNLAVIANLTRYFEHALQLTARSPEITTLDTPGNVIDLRGRIEARLDMGSFAWTSALNYTDDYDDPSGLSRQRIDSLVTADASVAYRAGTYRLALHVTNLFDEDPPFYNNPNGIGYDNGNDDPFGRTVSLRLSRTW